MYISSNPPDEVFTLQQICEVNDALLVSEANAHFYLLYCLSCPCVQELERYHPAILFVCQGESSVGLYQPLAGVGRLCHK